MGTQKNKSVSNRSREAASNPDTITWYLGRPLTYLDLDHTGIRHDTHAGILHEHGLVDFHRHVGDGIALPMLDGRPVAPGPAQEEAREAVFNMVPTGRHWETEDGMDDPYVWTRSGAKVMLTIKRHSKVLKSEFTGLEAFMIKEYKNLEEEENSNHRDPTVVVVGPKKCRLKIKLSAKQPEADDETASILSDDGTAIITALDEGADILGSSKKRKTKYTRPDKAVPRAELGRDGRLKSTQHRRRPKMPKTKIAPARMISSSKTMQPSPLDRRREVQQKGVRKTSEIVVDWFDSIANPEIVEALEVRSQRARKAALDAISPLSSRKISPAIQPVDPGKVTLRLGPSSKAGGSTMAMSTGESRAMTGLAVKEQKN